ncbi:GH92 family glycosyl hydrolase [uncultured Polaribacter sp.]|uniref:GH92 family glycosyl hydrolase n=1 Tax=uncultured Polaribacter sp. TaxID=174711 RepID=UPI00260D8DBA|nr:GH92 family glycosyl hydrolase [uncultured Polaribacter sp.]
MKKISLLIFLSVLLSLTACSKKHLDSNSNQKNIDNAQFVNPFIGTGGHGHTFPGSSVPNSMVQLSPDTRTNGWDACGGYHHTDSSILGFSHTHLSGTGIGDLGDFLFMPFTGKAKTTAGTAENPDAGYRSRFSHEKETSIPGYYSVDLLDYDIKAELTSSKRAGFHKYTFLNDDSRGLIINMKHSIHHRNVLKSEIKVISDTEIVGYRNISGWAHNRHIYFHAKFNNPFTVEFFENGVKQASTEIGAGRNLIAVLKFKNVDKDQIMTKVGISSVDDEGAKNNVTTEIPDWNFEKVKNDAQSEWKTELSSIDIEGGTKEQRAIFYTGLYHTSMSPYTFNDVDGRYMGMDQKIYSSGEKDMYTVFSLWDTFRAFHPLMTIINPEKNDDFVKSLLNQYDQGGILPKWELNGNYTGTMIGYHSIPVIVDAYFKGDKDFDVEKAYEAMVHASNYNTERVLFPSETVKEKLSPKAKLYKEEFGYIPADMENESVSKGLEYAYNDWCIAQIAKALGKDDDYKLYMERSMRYKKYFDSKTGFMRGVNKDGSFREPFDPKFSRHRKDDYVEGNAWQWNWFVTHDVNGLVELMGGKDKFSSKLDELFSTSSEINGEHTSGDISGLIGQYAHGNEPSHHITHIYNFIDQPWKTQKLTDKIMSTLYFDNPNGLSGNEDCGQMSAWYILNAMGFYSFNPGDSSYSVGRPIFDKVTINLKNGKKFTVKVKNNSSKNMYIQSLKMNEKKLAKPFFTHKDIMNGGILEFKMGATENKTLFH